jgi:capsular polysaccharide export protein
VVVDDVGIYYDATRPSSIELLLESAEDVLAGIDEEVTKAKRLILQYRLSKYNHAPLLEVGGLPLPGRPPLAGEGVNKRVLVVDQTAGDLSVQRGTASTQTFLVMLAAAYAENPDAVIYVKTHPEVSAGRKGGYLSAVQDDERTVVLRDNVNPMSLIEHMDRVYVVTSQMGFEALLAGKPVTCFGMPWYAGWGVTDDRQRCERRTRLRNVNELFAAAYFHYTRYLDPITHERGTIFDVIRFLIKQRAMAEQSKGRTVCIGFSRHRMANVRPFVSLYPNRVKNVRNAKQAAVLNLGPQDRLVCWGREVPAEIEALAQETGARLVRMEDGFVRSVGLGSDLIKPLSLVMDGSGLYFDPSRESDLEKILNEAPFTQEELGRAEEVREFMVRHGITKYNLESRISLEIGNEGRPVVFVPGQVEDDASIRFGCEGVNTNRGLLDAARRAQPDAFIIYKPHPDVVANNRKGGLSLTEAKELADRVDTRASVISCIEAADEVHTMTSLSGFDALLRGKRVVVYGRPFYAGWGLTEDRLTVPRRKRSLTLDELVAGALLRYPLYWDWELKGYAECEAVLRRIVERRDALERDGGLEKLRSGFWRRQVRKAGLWARSWRPGQW